MSLSLVYGSPSLNSTLAYHGLPIFSFLRFHVWVSLGFALNAAILSLLQGQLQGRRQATGTLAFPSQS